MKVAVVVHSKTGVSLSFAGQLAEALRRDGHEAQVHRIEGEGDVQPHQKDVRLVSSPDLDGCDALVVGGPIWAFGMSPVALAFAGSLGDISGMKVVPFATMGFPFAFLGGLQGVGRLGRLLAERGGNVARGVVIPTMLRRHDVLRLKAVETVRTALGG